MSTAPGSPRATGSCLCGAVRYAVHGPMRPVIMCHCGQCRRQSGHHVAATACRREHLEVLDEGTLAWFAPDTIARRGFCSRCGSNLFWSRLEPDAGEYISIMAGTLDGPTGLKAIAHIFVADAGDYYSIADGLPCHAARQESG